ncbi:MAG: AAA family ATPase [Deltaproteobacteria bacterium]|nr:AAA family ATPase [Deltaproteobacteria bacterium]
MNEIKTIAVCGKGGVGKTSLAALLVAEMSRELRKRILAIDADPASGLALSLGVTVLKTIDDIRREIVGRLRERAGDDRSVVSELLDYEVFHALAEGSNTALLAIGRPEDAGCYCRVNALLRDIIADLAENFDIVVIDGEAGVEQINRRVMERVDYLLIVSDLSAKGIAVSRTIWHLIHDNRALSPRGVGLVLNRGRSDREVSEVLRDSPVELLGWIPEDEHIRNLDISGTPLTEIPRTAPSMTVVRNILHRLSIGY